MKTSLFFFSVLLLICQYFPLNFTAFLAILLFMAVATAMCMNFSMRRLYPLVLLVSLLVLVALGHNADLQYGILKFNSEIYPVSLQDYIAILIAVLFGYFYLGKKTLIALKFVQTFACMSAFLISLAIVKWFTDSSYPVYQNSNWSGTLIVSILFLSAGLLFQETSKLMSHVRQTSSSNYATIFSLGIICSINFYLLLATASRSATISFFAFLMPIFSHYNFLLLRLARTSKKIFLMPALIVTFAFYLTFSMAIYNSNFYLKLTNFMDFSNVLRLHFYGCYLKLILEHSWLGVGIGKSAQLCEEMLSSTIGSGKNHAYVNHAHNFLLQIGADHGVLILLIFISFIVAYIWSFFVFVKINQQSEQDMIVFAVYMTTFAIGLASMFQAAVYHAPFLQIWTGILVGVSAAYTSNVRAQLKGEMNRDNNNLLS